jgi:hypothetical protein
MGTVGEYPAYKGHYWTNPVGAGEGRAGNMTEGISSVLTQTRSGLEFELNQSPARRKISLASRTSSLVPYVIISFPWLFGAFAASVVAWFAILVTGRYPSGLFAFNVRAWRFLVTTTAYASIHPHPAHARFAAYHPGGIPTIYSESADGYPAPVSAEVAAAAHGRLCAKLCAVHVILVPPHGDLVGYGLAP